MKAAVYYENGGPEVFRYEDVPDPVCRENRVDVEVGAVSIKGGNVLNRAGAAVFATPSSQAKLNRRKGNGVDHGIDYVSQDFVAEVERITDGRRIDVIADAVGAEVTQRGFQVSAYRARVVMYGSSTRGVRKYDVDMMRGNRAPAA